MGRGLPLACGLVFLSGGCSVLFDPGAGAGPVDAGDGPGKDGSAGADAGAVTSCKDWDPPPKHFDPCDLPLDVDPLILSESGTYLYDTATQTLTSPSDDVVAHDAFSITQLGESSPAVLVAASQIEVGANATLAVTGGPPLILASWSTIGVTGEIDAGSHAGDSAAHGPGARPLSECASPLPSAVGCNSNGCGGGGGGGFGAAGGDGGGGGDGDTGGIRAPGGTGRPALAPADLTGGCGGQPGGDLTAENYGGGAIQLAAAESITVSGRVLAGGAGGVSDSQGSLAGGGGGGSGGMILLDAPSGGVNGVLAANGGGGGGGSESESAGADGTDAQPINQAAPGGPSTSGGTGGTGGFGDSEQERTGGTGDDATGLPQGGGGGGGGGAGIILIKGAFVTGGGVISPTPTIITAPSQ